MTTNTKFYGSLATLGIMALCSGSALAVSIGDKGTLSLTRVAGYFGDNGGEFTLTPLTTTSGPIIDNLAYEDVTIIGASQSRSFQSFCIEYNEYTNSPVAYNVNSEAVNGGVGGGSPDPLSVATTILYSKFATDGWATASAGYTPTTYNYTPGAGREADAKLLQRAIWILENEIASFESNKFLTALGITSGNLGTFRADHAAVGQNGVYVLNLTDVGSDTKRQDMLFFDDGGFRVPDGGMTVLLLGLAMGGLGLARRFTKS